MAAYAALVSLMNDLDDIQNHPRHSFSFDNKQMSALSQTVDFLIDFLESHNSHECSTEALESRIASAAHAAHDLIESHVLNQIHAGSTLLGKVRSYFLLDLQKVINNMDFFRRKAMQFKARSGFLKTEQPAYSAVASNSEKNIMVGFDDVRDQLMHRLTGDPSGHRQVIPLVGMGGIEGFLRPNKSLSLEEVAEEYLKDLIERNLVLIHERRWNGKVIYCGIHDSVRELCLKVGKKEKFIHRESCTVLQHPQRKHYVVIGDERIERLVRSRVGFGDFSRQLGFRFRIVSGFVKDGRCVEAAHFQLHKLRYLHFYQATEDNRCCRLSPISLFWNVKTLIIYKYSCDIIVPFEIWEMPQLRHLEFNGICLPVPLPNQEECIVLQNLHTLLGVRDLSLSEEVCKRIPNIKNLYVVYNVHSPGDFEAICPHNLGLLNKLEQLRCSLYGNADSKWRDFVLSFTFPNSLKKLSLEYLTWNSLTIIKSLVHLEDLELNWMKGPTWNLVDEEFRSLKFLQIFSADDLSVISANSSHFPVLEKLHIKRAPKLIEIPFDIGEIPTLQLIKLTRCNASAVISAMSIVEEQESSGNQDIRLDIRHLGYKENKRFQKWRKSRI